MLPFFSCKKQVPISKAHRRGTQQAAASSGRSPRRSPPKAEPVLQTPSVTFAPTPAEAAPQAPAEDQGPARTSNVSDMSLDDEDEEEEPPRRSERIQQRTSSASEASAEDVSAPNKENDEPPVDSPEERRRAAASFKARRRRRTVDARCLLGDDSPVEKARVVLAAWSDEALSWFLSLGMLIGRLIQTHSTHPADGNIPTLF